MTVPCTALRARAGISLAGKPAITSFRADRGTGAAASPLAGTGLRPRPGQADRARDRAGPAAPPDEGTVLDLVAVLTAGGHAALATAHRAAARCYIEEHLTAPGWGGADRRGDRDQRAAALPGLRRRRHVRPPARPGPPSPARVLHAGRAARAGPGAGDRGRRRRPLRLHLGGLLLARVPPALRPARERRPRSAQGERIVRSTRGRVTIHCRRDPHPELLISAMPPPRSLDPSPGKGTITHKRKTRARASGSRRANDGPREGCTAYACLRRRTRRDRDPNRTSRGDRRADRRLRAGGRRGRAAASPACACRTS